MDIWDVFSLRFFQNGVQAKEINSYSSTGVEQYELLGNRFTEIMTGGKVTLAYGVIPIDASPVTIIASDTHDSKTSSSLEVDPTNPAPAPAGADAAAGEPAPAAGDSGESAAAEDKAPAISLGDTVATRDIEFTLESVEFTYDLLPSDTSGVYMHYPPRRRERLYRRAREGEKPHGAGHLHRRDLRRGGDL